MNLPAMDDPNQAPHMPVLSSPPVHGGIVAAQPTTWPMVFGIIAIIIASLGILSNGCGGVAGPFIQMQMAKMAPAGNNPVIDAQVAMGKKYLWFQLANAAVLSGLGVMLLSAGIGMVRRRSWARQTAMMWAWLRIVFTVPTSYVGYQIAVDTMKLMVQATNSGAAGGTPMPAGTAAFFQVFGVIGIILGAALVCIFPVFTIIWFSRAKIKAEVAAWSAPKAV